MSRFDRPNRRTVLKTAGGLSTLGLAGCLGSLGGGGSETVTIGALAPNTGPLGLFGQINQQGYEFARDQLDGEILGSEYEVIVRDTQTNPSTGVQRARELVEQENVDALVGIVSSAVGINAIQYIKNDAQIPWIASQVGTNAAREQSQFCNRYSFFPWPSFRQMYLANDRLITEVIPEREDVDPSSVYIVSMDFEAGQSARDIITKFVEDRGGTVDGVTMVPMSVSDWSTYLPDPMNSDADIVTGFIPGSQAVGFINQASNFGLFDEKTMAFAGDTTSPIVLGAVGDTADGMYSTHWWDPNRDTDLNNSFIQWIQDNVDDLPPNEVHANAYNQIWSLAQAMEDAGSTNPDDVISALEGMSYNSPMGELTYRAEDHQTQLNFIADVVEGGSLNTLERYPDVIGEAFCSV